MLCCYGGSPLLFLTIVVCPSRSSDPQSTHVPSFENYVADFASFVAFIQEEDRHAGPLHVLAHSMGGLIAACAMLRNPNMVSYCQPNQQKNARLTFARMRCVSRPNAAQVDSAVFMAPMFRMHCGTPAMLWHFPLPFPITHLLTSLACSIGMEKSHAVGFFNEEPDAKIRWALTTDETRLERWRQLRMKYPSVISCCVTNRWVVEAIRLQTWFGTCSSPASRLSSYCCKMTSRLVWPQTRSSHERLQRAVPGVPSDLRPVCK